ncbi:MAG: hypothetical protein HY422_00285 [Candidatus Komeilibacteria bacterium]|nr:hypothetical protein [Candidatus Komeilibacteria bacterium]
MDSFKLEKTMRRILIVSIACLIVLVFFLAGRAWTLNRQNGPPNKDDPIQPVRPKQQERDPDKDLSIARCFKNSTDKRDRLYAGLVQF